MLFPRPKQAPSTSSDTHQTSHIIVLYNVGQSDSCTLNRISLARGLLKPILLDLYIFVKPLKLFLAVMWVIHVTPE